MPNMRGDYVKNPVAYCALHHFVMRPKDMTRRACIKKCCRHLRKLEHPYWAYRAKALAERAERKRQKKASRG